MNANNLKRRMIVTPRTILSTGGGYVRGPGIAVQGCKLKVVRPPTKHDDGVQCEMLPRDDDNGPVYVHTFPCALVEMPNDSLEARAETTNNGGSDNE